MDERTKQLEELIKAIKVTVQSEKKSIQCKLCKQYFKKYTLHEHQENIHSFNGSHFKCSICDYSTKRNQAFKIHVSAVHGDPDHKCLICKKYFKKSMLQAHKEQEHSNMISKCNVCGIEF